jgi:hypothetical protein
MRGANRSARKRRRPHSNKPKQENIFLVNPAPRTRPSETAPSLTARTNLFLEALSLHDIESHDNTEQCEADTV